MSRSVQRNSWQGYIINEARRRAWKSNVDVNYQLFRHVGLDLSYQYFDLSMGDDRAGWKGGADMTYSGPVISLTGNW